MVRLGLAEDRQGALRASGLVQGIGQPHPPGHSLKGIAAAAGQLHALLGCAHRGGYVAQRQVQFAEVGSIQRSFYPILLLDPVVNARLHRLDRIAQASQSTQLGTHQI